MSLPGTEVHRIVERGSRDAKRFADLTGAELHAAQQAILVAVERRGQALAELARHYLPSLDDSAIAATFAEVRDELREIQARKAERVAELRAAIVKDGEERSTLERDVADVTARLQEHVARREELQTLAAQQLQEDPGFQQLANDAARAEARLERDEERAEELAREAAEKLPAYERSRLFRYLRDREFGTTRYASRGPVRRIDRWVADLIDYADARSSYDFLRATPELVAQEVEHRREEFEATMERIESKRTEAATAVGLPELISEGEAVGARRDELVDALDAVHDRDARARSVLSDLEEERGGFHAEALQKLGSYLDRLGTVELEAHARETAETIDDRLVTEIAAATREAGQMERSVARLGTQRRSTEQRALELQHIAQRMRQSNFDSIRSRFDGIAAVDLERRIQRIAEGSESADGLWKDLSGRQRFDEPWQPPAAPDHGAHTGAPWPPNPRGGRTAKLGGGGGGFPWWVVQALGAVVDVALSGAASRGVSRRAGGFRIGGGGGRSSSSSAGGGGTRGGGGSFTRGSGF